MFTLQQHKNNQTKQRILRVEINNTTIKHLKTELKQHYALIAAGKGKHFHPIALKSSLVSLYV